MDVIEIGVRVHLDQLRVQKTDDGVVAGSADEPYLWSFVLTVDGTSVFENVPDTAEVRVHSTSPAISRPPMRFANGFRPRSIAT